MKAIIFILVLLLTLQSCDHKSNLNAQNDLKERSTYIRVVDEGKYGMVNEQGDTIIPLGKYQFLNPVDDRGMILATNKQKKKGYIDINENVLIPFVYHDLGIFTYNITYAQKDGYYGYINRHGKTVMDFQFLAANYFNKPGIAVVNKANKWGIIDTLGNFKVECIYDELDYSAENEVAVLKNKNKWAFYFLEKDLVTDFKFDEIYPSSNRIPQKRSYNSEKELYFNKNLALVRKGKQFALVNERLEEVVKYGEYNEIKPMNCYGFSIVRKNNKYGIIDSLGKLKVPLQYESISIAPTSSYENEFTTYLVSKNGKYQILNQQAELEIKQFFDKVEILPDNYYLAYVNKSTYLINDNSEVISKEYSGFYDFEKGFIVRLGNKMGTIDYDGNITLEFVYDSLFHRRFEQSLYAKKGGKFGVIDFKGNVILPFEYESIDNVWYDGHKEHQQNLIVSKNKKFGTINLKNEVVIPLIYDGISGWVEHSPDDHYVKKDLKYGMVKPSGEILIPCVYEYIHYYTPQTVLVERNWKFGILNRENETILPCEYERILVDINFWGFDKNHQDKFILLKAGKWSYHDLDGKLISGNIPESEILKKYPNALNKIKHSLDFDLIFVR